MHLLTAGATPTLMTSTTPMPPFVHGSGLLLFAGTKIQTRYGTIMELSQISRYGDRYFPNTNPHHYPQPFTMKFPCADIHELLTSDLLHQVIKGTFKDHLVQWVEDYLKLIYGPTKGQSILDEIDRRCVGS